MASQFFPLPQNGKSFFPQRSGHQAAPCGRCCLASIRRVVANDPPQPLRDRFGVGPFGNLSARAVPRSVPFPPGIALVLQGFRLALQGTSAADRSPSINSSVSCFCGSFWGPVPGFTGSGAATGLFCHRGRQAYGRRGYRGRGRQELEKYLEGNCRVNDTNIIWKSKYKNLKI